MFFCPAVLCHFAFFAQVEWRSGYVDVALLDEFFHVAEEECQNQRGYVCAVHVGIGHDDDFVVAQLFDVQCFAVFFGADGYAESGVDVAYLFAFERFVEHGFFDVQNFASQWQNGLERAVAAAFGRSAGRITFDEEQFADGGVFARAVGKFAGQSATECRFA